MDAVYILGQTSMREQYDLLFSLRSLHKHMKDLETVWLIGDKPLWDIRGVRYIPATDGPSKQHNIMEKIRLACQQPELSQEFLFVNDDHYLKGNFMGSDFPFYYQGNLTQQNGHGPDDLYRVPIHNTVAELKRRGLTSLNFDVHCPIRYDKSLFISTMDSYPWHEYSFVVKSLYSNTVLPESRTEWFNLAPYQDVKIDQELPESAIKERIAGSWCFSTGRGGLCPPMTSVLSELFLDPSPYEPL